MSFRSSLYGFLFMGGILSLAGCTHFSSGDAKNAPIQSVPKDSEAKVFSPGPPLKVAPKNSQEMAKLFWSTGEELEKHHPDQAIPYYEKALEADPRMSVQATKKLAVLHDLAGNFDKALVQYQSALQQNPKDADLWNDMGYGYYNRGKWEKAEECLRKAVALKPGHPRGCTNLGMTLAQLGNYDESLVYFQKAVGKPQALCNIAFIQTTQGKRLEARQTYEEALRLEPGLQIAQSALRKLDGMGKNALSKYAPSKTRPELDEEAMSAVRKMKSLRQEEESSTSGWDSPITIYSETSHLIPGPPMSPRSQAVTSNPTIPRESSPQMETQPPARPVAPSVPKPPVIIEIE